MNRLIKLLNLIDLILKNKLAQDSIGERGKDGRLRETHIHNMVYSGFSSFSFSSPDGLPGISTRVRNFFKDDKETINEEPECPGDILIEDTCIHDKPSGGCNICEEEKITDEEPTEIEEEYQVNK